MLLLSYAGIFGQEDYTFRMEVEGITTHYDPIWEQGKPTIVFTGSSSIRLWPGLTDLYPDYQVINSGFGGSKTSDLQFFSNELIYRYRPDKVIIYEGDNDIYDGMKPRDIRNQMKTLVHEIKAQPQHVEIFLLAAKPSPARWHLKKEYKRLNRKLRRICRKDDQITFINIWDPMIMEDRQVRRDIFIEDELHMNEAGYDIWHEIIKNYIN